VGTFDAAGLLLLDEHLARTVDEREMSGGALTVFHRGDAEELSVIFLTQRQLGGTDGLLWGPATPPIRPLVYGALT
jgi:hypothetical protein